MIRYALRTLRATVSTVGAEMTVTADEMVAAAVHEVTHATMPIIDQTFNSTMGPSNGYTMLAGTIGIMVLGRLMPQAAPVVPPPPGR